jgi:hypothetical protein
MIEILAAIGLVLGAANIGVLLSFLLFRRG